MGRPFVGGLALLFAAFVGIADAGDLLQYRVYSPGMNYSLERHSWGLGIIGGTRQREEIVAPGFHSRTLSGPLGMWEETTIRPFPGLESRSYRLSPLGIPLPAWRTTSERIIIQQPGLLIEGRICQPHCYGGCRCR